MKKTLDNYNQWEDLVGLYDVMGVVASLFHHWMVVIHFHFLVIGLRCLCSV